MSLTTAEPRLDSVSVSRILVMAGLALLAVALALFAISLIVSTLAPAPPPAAPVHHPFGPGGRSSTPNASGIFGWLIAVQADFFQKLTAALRSMKENGAAAQILLMLSFAYGVFHAAGPGHGKAVIAGYIVASERALRRGILLSFSAALLQALVAIAIVVILAIALGSTAARITNAERWVEIVSYIAVFALGLTLLWRKASRMAKLTSPAATSPDSRSGHWHLPPAEAVDRLSTRREWFGVIFAAGIRPCSGAIVVLVFSWSQGLLAAGMLAVLAMALGTAITTSLISVFAVAAKRAALAMASGSGQRSLMVGACLELLAAAFITILGAGLATGTWFTTGVG